ncbi:hypothetical protein ACSBR1_040048 [Camellia fascicularis]
MNGDDDSDHEINGSNLPHVTSVSITLFDGLEGFERDHGDEFSIGGNDLDYEFGGSNTISGLRETEMSLFNDNYLNPKFRVSVEDVGYYCLETYEEVKEKVKQVLRNLDGQISLSVDILRHEKRYEYPQDYLCLTTYFIDNNWKLKKWILRFSQIWDGFSELPHKIILKSLKDWDIEEKLSTITMLNDNLDIVSRMVQVAYKAINNIIDNVRELCSFGKSLPLWYLTSAQLKDALELESGGEFSSQDVRDNYEVPSNGRRLEVYVNLWIAFMRKDMYLVLVITMVMDPGFKMKYLEFSSSKFDDSDGIPGVTTILEAIRSLFNNY